MSTQSKAKPLFYGPIVRRAVLDAFRKLNPRHVVRNPVMFVVEVGSLLTSILAVLAFSGRLPENPWFILGVSIWLWFTVLFANFAEAMAEGRGKAQADTLRKARRDILAKKLRKPRRPPRFRERCGEQFARRRHRIGACQPADSGRR